MMMIIITQIGAILAQRDHDAIRINSFYLSVCQSVLHLAK